MISEFNSRSHICHSSSHQYQVSRAQELDHRQLHRQRRGHYRRKSLFGERRGTTISWSPKLLARRWSNVKRKEFKGPGLGQQMGVHLYELRLGECRILVVVLVPQKYPSVLWHIFPSIPNSERQYYAVYRGCRQLPHTYQSLTTLFYQQTRKYIFWDSHT